MHHFPSNQQKHEIKQTTQNTTVLFYLIKAVWNQIGLLYQDRFVHVYCITNKEKNTQTCNPVCGWLHNISFAHPWQYDGDYNIMYWAPVQPICKHLTFVSIYCLCFTAWENK